MRLDLKRTWIDLHRLDRLRLNNNFFVVVKVWTWFLLHYKGFPWDFILSDHELDLYRLRLDRTITLTWKNLPQGSSNKLDLVRIQTVLHRLCRDRLNDNFFVFGFDNSTQRSLRLELTRTWMVFHRMDQMTAFLYLV